MKSLVFDTSSVISIVTNDLLWVLKDMRKNFKGDFFIPSSVKFELVDKAKANRLYKLEAIMISKSIDDRELITYQPLNVDDLLLHVNSIFSFRGNPLHILDRAEVEALALVLRLQADAYVVDERTMRLLVEDPMSLKRLLEGKLHRKIDVNKKLLKEFEEIYQGVKIIRSTELMTVAYEMGLFDGYITKENNNKDLLDGLLWGLRLRGSAISTDEINEIIGLEVK